MLKIESRAWQASRLQYRIPQQLSVIIIENTRSLVFINFYPDNVFINHMIISVDF